MSASPERSTIAWLRARSGISALVGTRVAASLPENPTLPFLVVSLVGGAPVDGETPDDLPAMQLDCLGATRTDADALMRAVIDASKTERNQTDTTEGHVYGISVAAYRRADDVDALTGNVRRYGFIVDAFVHMHE